MAECPKHGSWLNQAEIEISVFERVCLSHPLPDIAILRQHVQRLYSAKLDAVRSSTAVRHAGIIFHSRSLPLLLSCVRTEQEAACHLLVQRQHRRRVAAMRRERN